MEKYIEVFKKLWNIPRWNALIKITLYLIFFAIMLLLLSLTSTNKKEKIKNEIDYNNYEFIIKINNQEIKGLKKDNIAFSYNDVNYIFEDELICDLDDCSIDFMYVFDLFSPKLIDDYMKKGNLLGKTKYTDGRIEYKYEINDENVKKYFNIDSSFELSYINQQYILNLENYNIFDKIIISYK